MDTSELPAIARRLAAVSSSLNKVRAAGQREWDAIPHFDRVDEEAKQLDGQLHVIEKAISHIQIALSFLPPVIEVSQ